jgi:hypothetical protein
MLARNATRPLCLNVIIVRFSWCDAFAPDARCIMVFNEAPDDMCVVADWVKARGSRR